MFAWFSLHMCEILKSTYYLNYKQAVLFYFKIIVFPTFWAYVFSCTHNLIAVLYVNEMHSRPGTFHKASSLCAMNGCMHSHSPTTLNHHNLPLHTHMSKQPCYAQACMCCTNQAADTEPHFIPQLAHPTWRPSYNTTYYTVMRHNIDACVYTEKQGSVRREIGKEMGPYAA